ncbi:MAG: preprotein translocase subunit SecE [Thermodesulfobacteriota bacterium]
MAGKKEETGAKAVENGKGASLRIANIKEFMADVKREFHKVAWPDKKHTLASTWVVVLFVVLVSFYLGTVDLLLGKLVGLVLR